MLVNSLGGVTELEQLVFNNDVCALLEADGVNVGFDRVGTFLTSFGMTGISLTLLRIDDADWLNALQGAVSVAAW